MGKRKSVNVTLSEKELRLVEAAIILYDVNKHPLPSEDINILCRLSYKLRCLRLIHFRNNVSDINS